MTETQILEILKTSFEDAPKSKAGFVNYRRARNIALNASADLILTGIPAHEAYAKIYAVWKPYDTHFSKLTEDPDFYRLP